MEGATIEYYQAKGETVISESYCVLLSDEMKPGNRTKQRGRVSVTAILQHNNIRLQAANKTLETIRDLKVELLEHTA
jgi:hypothetical protein